MFLNRMVVNFTAIAMQIHICSYKYPYQPWTKITSENSSHELLGSSCPNHATNFDLDMSAKLHHCSWVESWWHVRKFDRRHRYLLREAVAVPDQWAIWKVLGFPRQGQLSTKPRTRGFLSSDAFGPKCQVRHLAQEALFASIDKRVDLVPKKICFDLKDAQFWTRQRLAHLLGSLAKGRITSAPSRKIDNGKLSVSVASVTWPLKQQSAMGSCRCHKAAHDAHLDTHRVCSMRNTWCFRQVSKGPALLVDDICYVRST